MAREHDGAAAVGQLANDASYQPDAQHIESVRRFVQNHIRGRMDERARERDLLALAERERGGAAVGDGGQPQLPNQLVHLGLQAGWRDLVEQAGVLEMLANRLMVVKSAGFGYHTQPRASGSRVAPRVVSVDKRVAAMGREIPGSREAPWSCRAIWTEQARDLSVGRGGRNRARRDRPAILL